MTDNVIILGAGASVNAGIPLLSNFVDKMWEIATRGKHNDKELSDDDKKIFDEAMKIRNELDGYHGRASFDDRNIEDILSILSFNLIEGKESDRTKLNWMIKAITKTIELSCTVTHNGVLNQIQGNAEIYQEFWKNLFNRFRLSPSSFPSIISFNYDLVLERSLFQTLISTLFNNTDPVYSFPFDGITLKYRYKHIDDLSYLVKYTRFDDTSNDFRQIIGTKLVECTTGDLKNPIDIEILKLHGSLNFPSSQQADHSTFKPTNIVLDPYIVPPNINKSISSDQTMWSAGLQKLREAKNIIIVGYSMPQTDIHMQYFIKAGIGPNVNLNKVIVFNPALFNSGKENDAMRERFGNCFSPQMQTRVDFHPKDDGYNFDINDEAGTFKHFVHALSTDNNLFFS